MSSNHISSTSRDTNDIGLQQRVLDYDHLELKPFDYTEYNAQDLEDEIDPDNRFFSSININCNYFTEDDYNNNIDSEGILSIIHFNCRSMYSNFNTIKDYLQQFIHPFSIIAMSETWFNEDKGIDFELEGYDLNYMNRANKAGGGVSIYVHKNSKFKVIDKMTLTINDILECITIEIHNEKQKNIIVSCVYI